MDKLLCALQESFLVICLLSLSFSQNWYYARGGQQEQEMKAWKHADARCQLMLALGPSLLLTVPHPPCEGRKESQHCSSEATAARDEGCAEHPCKSLSLRVASNSKWKFKSFSSFLFSHHRFRILWEEEVDRMGPEKASLGRVVWKFQRTRVLMDIVANILCIIMAAVGQVSRGSPSSALSPRSPDWQTMSLVTFSTSW